jgi:methionyl-tRNA formyltransferase
MKIVITNSNPIHKQLEERGKQLFDATIINSKQELSFESLHEIKPDFVFFLHWSHLIPKPIFENFNCIVFHMTDLPYGRGGSPLQNLIVRGHSETMISALKVDEGIDTGPILLKRKLFLFGTAEEIFLRAGNTMLQMIDEICVSNPQPIKQEGEVTLFTRRTPAESNIDKLTDIDAVYDYIRMLDGEGYPKAFIQTQHLRFEFTRASLKANGIIAEVKITKK